MCLQKDLHTGSEHLEVAFEFRKMRFVYHESINAFERLRFPVHEPFEYYLKATGGIAVGKGFCSRVDGSGGGMRGRSGTGSVQGWGSEASPMYWQSGCNQHQQRLPKVGNT
jgi:hypothetical protein